MIESIGIEQQIALAPLTTLKVGGAARFFVRAETAWAVAEAVEFARSENLPLFVLGGGSNLLVADTGFDGLVLQISLTGVDVRQEKSDVFVTAAAGEDWDELVRFCVERAFAGIECLSGIPGTVGASPVQNIGAYGQDVSETIAWVKVFERASGKIFDLTNDDCGFAYRASIFNTTHKEKFIVLSVTFRLKPDGSPKIEYKDLQRYFAEGEQQPTLQNVREAVLKIRRAKSMILLPNDPNSKSAGSFFKNPIVNKSRFAETLRLAKTLNLGNVPNFVVDAENIKIPAAWLIENSGFHKGYKSGEAGLSEKHTLAIVNLGNAKAQDILNLKEKIQAKVEQTFGILLQPEPVFLGVIEKND